MRTLLLLSLGLAGCAPNVSHPAGSDPLAIELAGRTPGAKTTCISNFGNQNVRVVNSSTVAYGHGRTIYLNRLTSMCPGLDQHNALIIETQGGQYCRGDHIRALEPGSTIPGPTCFLGDWTAYRR